MKYKLLDKDGNEIIHHNLQDKKKWCEDGQYIENVFISIYGDLLKLIINPEKQKNKYAPDLLHVKCKRLGDLKFQGTPFFRSRELCGIDPTYAVVFNEKDRIRYSINYPNLLIYFWINWEVISFISSNKNISVTPLCGVWGTYFKDFNNYLQTCYKHEYIQRYNDNNGNAKFSYICDIRNEIFKRLI